MHPRLVHTRFGLHIIEVLHRKKGTLQTHEAVRDQIAGRLELRLERLMEYPFVRREVGAGRLAFHG